MTGPRCVVEMHNELRDTPKTGDDSKLGLWLALAGVSAAGIAAVSYTHLRPSKENGATVLPHLQGTKSREILAAESGESHEQIRKDIRLTNLVPELLEFVDEGRIKMRPAVELSYRNEDCQRDLVDEIDLNDCTPSHEQAIRIRKFFEEGKLTTEAISAIMSEEKPNQREKSVLRGDRVRSLIPKNIPINQTEEYVCKALEHYNKFLRNRYTSKPVTHKEIEELDFETRIRKRDELLTQKFSNNEQK